jgi:hypothetical protein
MGALTAGTKTRIETGINVHARGIATDNYEHYIARVETGMIRSTDAATTILSLPVSSRIVSIDIIMDSSFPASGANYELGDATSAMSVFSYSFTSGGFRISADAAMNSNWMALRSGVLVGTNNGSGNASVGCGRIDITYYTI